MKIEHEKAGNINTHDIKNGCGGIVDIEFIGQLLQLHYGYKHPPLQHVNTYNVINSAWELNILSDRDYNVLKKIISITKYLKILLEAITTKSSTRLPKDQNILTKIGKILGFKTDIPSKVLEEYYAVRNSTRACFNRIFNSLTE